jgi:hypothetical protein
MPPPPRALIYDRHDLQLHHFAAARTDDYMASMGTYKGYTHALPEGNRPYFGGDMICCPRATLYRAGAAYSSTILLRPVPTIIWHQWSPIKGTLAPNPRVIGPLLVEIYFVMSASPRPPYTGPAPPTHHHQLAAAPSDAYMASKTISWWCIRASFAPHATAQFGDASEDVVERCSAGAH